MGQAIFEALGARKMVFETAPFERSVEVSGFFALTAWVAIDCPDTDIYASIYLITVNETCIRLTTDAIRARYREGLRKPRLIRTNEPLRYDFAGFTFVSRLAKPGEKLRLVVAPTGRLVESMFTQKNYNGGGIVSGESAHEGRPVEVKLFHDRDHPSALYLPLGQPRSNDESH